MLVTLLGLVAVTLAACGVAPQPAAVTFVNQHRVAIDGAAAAVEEAGAELGAVSRPPSRPQLRRLQRTARRADERVNEVRAALPEAGAVEEEIPVAESEVGEGASELNHALAELISYARHPRPASLTRYSEYVRTGREQWNQAVIELWRLAKQSRPPTLRRSP